MAAARDNQLDIAIHLREVFDRFAVSICDKTDTIGWHAALLTATLKRFHDRKVRTNRLRPTAQNDSVARLSAQSCRLTRYIGARFINKSNHSNGHPHLGDPYSVRS